MADQKVSLADGGIVMLLVSKATDCPSEYLHHPLVHVIDVTMFDGNDVEKCFVSNSKAMITTAHMPKFFYERLSTELRRRKTNWMYRATTGAVEHTLDLIMETVKHPKSAPTDTIESSNGNGDGPLTEKLGKIAPHGAIKRLVEAEDDTTKSIGESARALLRSAQSKGYPTTIGSLEQALRKYRRSSGQTDRPASAMPKEMSKRLEALRILDEAIAGMTLIREYVEKTEAENEELNGKILRMKAALGV